MNVNYIGPPLPDGERFAAFLTSAGTTVIIAAIVLAAVAPLIVRLTRTLRATPEGPASASSDRNVLRSSLLVAASTSCAGALAWGIGSIV